MDSSLNEERSPSLGRVLGKKAIVYIGVLAFVFALLLIVNSSNASAVTNVNADITVDTEWTTAGDATYVIQASIAVTNDATLTIDAGVQVLFNGNYWLQIGDPVNGDGTLIAIGEDPITGAGWVYFGSNAGSPAAGDWNCLYFTIDQDGSQLEMCKIQYAYYGIWMEDTTITMNGLDIQNNLDDAINLRYSLGAPVSLNLNAISMVNIGYDGVHASGDNGVTVNLEGCAFIDYGNEGVYAYSSDGKASINMEDSLFMGAPAYSGLHAYADAGAYINCTDSTISRCTYHIYANADEEVKVTVDEGSSIGPSSLSGTCGIYAVSYLLGDVFVTLNDASITDVEDGIIAFCSNAGDVSVSITDAVFENNVDTAIDLYTDEGDMDLVLSDSEFNNSYVLVNAESYGDLDVNVDPVVITNTTTGFYLFSWIGDVTVIMDNVSAPGLIDAIFIGDPLFGTPEGGVSLTMRNCTLEGDGTMFSHGIEVNANLTVTINLTNVVVDYYFYGTRGYSTNGNIIFSADPCYFNRTYLSAIDLEAPTGSVQMTLLDVTMQNPSYDTVPAVEIDAEDGVVASLTNVLIEAPDPSYDMNAYLDIYTFNGTIDMDMNNVTMSSDTAEYGVWLDADNGTVDVDLIDVTIVLYEDYGTTMVEGDQSFTVDANDTILFDVDGLMTVFGYDSVELTAAHGDIVANFYQVLMWNIFDDFIEIYAYDGDVSLDVINGYFNNTDMLHQAEEYSMYDSQVVSVFATGDTSVTVEVVRVVDVWGGFWILSLLGDVKLDMFGVTMEGIAPNYAADYGVWVSSVEGSVDVNLNEVDIMLFPDDGTFAFPGMASFIIDANNTITFDALGLTIEYGYNGIELSNNVGSIDVNISDVEMWNVALHAIQISAPDGEASLVLTDGYFDNALMTTQYYATAIVWMQASDDVSAQIEDVDGVDVIGGFVFDSALGDVDLDLTDIDLEAYSPGWQSLSYGLQATAEEGSVEATFTDCVFGMYLATGWTFGGIVITANLTVELTVDGLEMMEWTDSIWVWTDNGSIEATIDGLDIDQSYDIGAAFYAPAGGINLTMTNSMIVNTTAGGSAVAALIAQAGGDLNIIMDEVDIIFSDGYGMNLLTTDGNLVLDLSNVGIMYCDETGIRGVAVNGNVVAEIDPSLIALCDVAIYLDSAFDMTFEMVDSTIWICDSGIELHAASGFMDIDLESDVINTTVGWGLFAEIDVDDIDFDMIDTTVMGTGMGIDLFTYDGAIDIDVSDSMFDNNNNYGLYANSTNGDIDLYMVDTLVNDSFIGILLDAFNGSLIIEMHGVTVSECYIGLDGFTIEGNITAVIDEESVFSDCYIGIYLDSDEDLNIAMSDSLVEECGSAGVELYADIEPLLINYDNMTFESNVVFGTFAELDDGDMFVNVHDSLFNNTVQWGMYLITSNGTIWLNIDPTTFHLGMWGVWASASEDIVATVADSFFLGQSVGGMEMYAGVDVYLDVTNTVFDGEEANNAAIMIPTEVESSYAIVDPDVNYTLSTITDSMFVPLGFDFPFNTGEYDEVLMSYQGWISPNLGLDPDPASPYEFASSYVDLIAATQYEWYTDDYAGFGYKVNDSRGAMLPNVVFQWYVWDSSQSQLKNVFEIWLYENGDIEFRYAMMDGQELQDYYYWVDYADYGISFDSGQNWNLKLLDVDFMDMDWSSVYFSMQAMSAGFGLYTDAIYNTTALITDSDFSHYMTGGAMMFSELGWMDVLVEETDFSYIYATTWDAPAALQVGSSGSIIDLTIAEGCSFEYIRGVAIYAYDTPVGGGVSTMSITNMVFNEVTTTAWLRSNVVEGSTPGTVDFVGTKTFSNNVGEHVGMSLLETNLLVDENNLTATVNDIMEDNVLTGGVNRWFATGTGGYLETYAMLGCDLDISPGDASVATVDWNVAANDNQIEEAGWVIHDLYYYYDTTSPVMDAIDADSDVSVNEEVSVTFNAELTAEGNNLSSSMFEFSEGIDLDIDASLIDGELFITTSMNANENLIAFEASGTYVGIDMEAWIYANNGRGDATLGATYTATNNEIYYALYEGIYIEAGMDAQNQFGDFFTIVDALVTDNEIIAEDEGIEFYFYNEVWFSTYFPPYEQSVSSSADMMFSSTVTRNTIQADTGVYLDAECYAAEDYYGVFSDASASMAGSMDVTVNDIWSNGNNYEDGGVSVYLYVSAYSGDAIATGDFDVTVENNDIEFWGDYGAGIYVVTYTYVGTEPRRYFDMPTCTMTTDFSFRNLTLEGDGIEVLQYVGGSRSFGEAHLITDVLVRDLTAYYFSDEGVSIEIYPTSYYDPYYWSGYPYAHADVEILVTNLTAVGNYYTYGECVGVEIASEGYNAWADGSVTIVENDLEYAYDGIYVWTYPAEVPVLIADNDITWCSEGIELWNVDMTVERNTLSDIFDYGIDLYGGTGTITENTITGYPGDDTTGIYLDVDDDDFTYPYYSGTVYDLLIEDNVLSDLGDDGIYIDDAMYLTIRSNTFTNIGGSGVELDSEYGNSYEVTVDQNDFTNIGDVGVYMGGVGGPDDSGADITQNTVDGADEGIEVEESYWVSIEDNILANVNDGIDIEDSNHVEILDNILSTSDIETGEGILAPGWGGWNVGLHLHNLSYVLVDNITITGFNDGVQVYDVNDLFFADSSVTWNLGHGMHVEDSEEVIVEDCVFTDNAWIGVWFNESSEIIFADNVVNHNGMEGLVFDYCYDVIVYNGEYRNNGEHGIVCWLSAIDWIVDDESIVEINPVDFGGDLTVVDGGVLLLNDVYMEIGSGWYGTPSIITVEEGGEMHAIDVTFDRYEYGFEFNVFGVLEMISSAEYGAFELYLGATSQVTIETSSIMWNERNGIHVDGCSPVIMSTTIALNARNGMYIEGASAAPEVTDCMIIMNMRGVYAVGSHLEDLTDNVFALNYEAGVFAEQVVGTIHDNMFLLDGKEIYVKDSMVSIEDNQIGYTTLVQVLMEFAPLLGLMNLSGDVFLPIIGSYVDIDLVINILAHHVGLYATNSEVTTSGNVYGLLTTAVIVTDSELMFGDEIKQNILLVPYMGVDSVIREMSMPVPVYDGIMAKNSAVFMSDAKIDVLDDALFLDHSTATVSSSTLTAMDFSFYLIRDSHASAADCTFGKVKVEDTSTFSVSEKLTVIVEDAWGAAVANVPVKIVNAIGETVATGSTDAEGKFVATVAAYVQTAAGKDSSVQPYAVTANYTLVPTTGYPGYNAEWSPKVVTKSVSISGPSSVTIQTGMIIRYQLITVAQDPDGRAVPGASVVYKNAQGETVSTGVTNAAGQYSALVIAYVMNPSSGKDTSMNPYDVTVTYPLVVTGYAGHVVFYPRTVSASATMEQQITTVTVKTGIKMYFDLTVTAKNKENKTAAGVWIVVYDATGAVAGNGPTDENGVFSIELLGWYQAADGTIDTTMNPYKVVAAFSSGEVESLVDMSSGSMSIVIMEHVEPAYDWTPVAVMGGVAALVLGAALFVVSRKP